MKRRCTRSGLNENHDVEQLAFVLFRQEGERRLHTVGIAQGQFSVQDILANFRKQKMKATLVRTNKVYPLAKTGMVVCFVDPSTMVFGENDAVNKALDARDGSVAQPAEQLPMMDAMHTVDSEPLWSILDKKGTQTMMRQVLGEAGSVTDFEAVKKAPADLLVLDELPARRQVRPDHRHRDTFASATLSSLLDARADAAQDQRLGGGEAGAERHHHRF